MSLLAAAVGVAQLVSTDGLPWLRPAAAGLLTLMAAATSVGGLIRWDGVDRAMRSDRPLPRATLPWVLSASLTLLTLLSLVIVLVKVLP